MLAAACLSPLLLQRCLRAEVSQDKRANNHGYNNGDQQCKREVLWEQVESFGRLNAGQVQIQAMCGSSAGALQTGRQGLKACGTQHPLPQIKASPRYALCLATTGALLHVKQLLGRVL